MSAFLPVPCLPQVHRNSPFLQPLRVLPVCNLTPDKSTRSATSSTAPGSGPAPPVSPTPPGHNRPPLLGLLLEIVRGHYNNHSLRKRYGPVYLTDALGRRTVSVSDLHLLNACVRNTSLTTVSAFPPYAQKLLSPNFLLFIDGSQARATRARYKPAFSPSLYPTYFNLVKESATALWTNVPTPTHKLPDLLNEHVLRTIARFSTGTRPMSGEPDALQRVCVHYNNLVAGLVSLPFTLRRRRALRGRDAILEVFADLVRERVSQDPELILALRFGKNTDIMAKLRGGSVDILTVLTASHDVSASGELDEEEVRSVAFSVLDIWLAGTFTQTNALTACVKELGSNREIWKALCEEQDNVTELTLESVREEMPLLESFVLEVLRLHPPLPGYMRRALTDMEIGGFHIAEGMVVRLDASAALRDEKVFHEPDVLHIDRFVGREDLAKEMQMVFGGTGNRHYCLGAALAKVTVMTTLAVLLRGFDIELEPRRSFEYVTLPATRPKDGVHVVDIRPRGT